MIELVFIVCLAITPTECEERRIAYLPEIGLMSCMMQAQQNLAQWQTTHPRLIVSRWTCEWSDTRAIKA
jgi:hypothetical protein